MKADILILCGGKGSRIKPIIGDIPKCLAPIAGKPFICHLLDQFESQGFGRFIFLLGHKSERIIKYLQDHRPGESEYVYSVEPHPLGAAGAIFNARDLIKSGVYIVVNGDTFCDVDYNKLVLIHRVVNPHSGSEHLYRGVSTGIFVLDKDWLNTAEISVPFYDIGTPEGYNLVKDGFPERKK